MTKRHGLRFLISNCCGALCLLSLFALASCASLRSDPAVVKSQLPGIIKKDEAKLEKNPDDQKLILETGSYYIMYANGFVQGPASMLPPGKYAERDAEYQKAKDLYLRGVKILRGGLEQKYPGIVSGAEADFQKEDVPSLYWLSAGTLLAYSINPLDYELGSKLPETDAFIKTAYRLDPDWNKGAIDSLLVSYYASIPEAMGGSKKLAKEHYDLALQKSDYLSVGTYVAWAESVCIPAQDYADFKDNLEKALAIDVNKDPENKLANILSRRKAKYLLENAKNFFIEIN
jgi:predicted anti-sigma-YlaC factor YlaD